MSTEMERFFKREETLEERLIAAGLGYPLSKEDAVKAYKTILVFRTDTPEMLDCELCFGVGHDFDAGLPCVLCCEPAKPVLDLIRKNADLQASIAGLKTGYEAYERVNAELRAECDVLKSQVKSLQAEPNSYQTGYDDGRKSSASHAENWRREAQAASAKVDNLRAECEALRKAMRVISTQVDGNIRETVRDCVNGRDDVQDIYGYCDAIDSLIHAAMSKEDSQ